MIIILMLWFIFISIEMFESKSLGRRKVFMTSGKVKVRLDILIDFIDRMKKVEN